MSSITGLISGGGGGTPVNSIARLYTNGQTQYTDPDGGVWLKTGTLIDADAATYPNAIISDNISGSEYENKSYDASATLSNISYTLELSSDGNKMYLYDPSSDRIHQFSLSTSWDISTASSDGINYDATAFSTPTQMILNDSGTKMWVTGITADQVHQYTLSTPFQVNTATYDSKAISVINQDGAPRDISWNNDGTKFYLVGSENNNIYEYNVGTAYEINTANYSGKSFSFTAQTTALGGKFNSNGTKFYGIDSDNVYEYSVSTAFDVSTFSLVATYNYTAAIGNIQGYAIYIKPDDTKFYTSNVNEFVYQFTLGSEKMGIQENTGTYDYVKLK